MKRKEIIKNYKAFFGIENMGLGENDKLIINWANELLKNNKISSYNNSLRKVIVQSHQFFINGIFHRYIDKDGETFALVESDGGYLGKYSLNSYWLEFRE